MRAGQDYIFLSWEKICKSSSSHDKYLFFFKPALFWIMGKVHFKTLMTYHIYAFIWYMYVCMRVLMKVKEESKTSDLNLNIQKTKIMASGPITSWQINGQTVKTVTDFIFLSSKITADGDCGCEIKRCMLLGRKAMTNLRQRIKKQRHHFANKGPYRQSWELDHKENWALNN